MPGEESCLGGRDKLPQKPRLVELFSAARETPTVQTCTGPQTVRWPPSGGPVTKASGRQGTKAPRRPGITCAPARASRNQYAECEYGLVPYPTTVHVDKTYGQAATILRPPFSVLLYCHHQPHLLSTRNYLLLPTSSQAFSATGVGLPPFRHCWVFALGLIPRLTSAQTLKRQ